MVSIDFHANTYIIFLPYCQKSIFLNQSQEIMVTNKISVTHEFLFIIIFIFPADDQINFALHPFHSLIGIQLVDKFYI